MARNSEKVVKWPKYVPVLTADDCRFESPDGTARFVRSRLDVFDFLSQVMIQTIGWDYPQSLQGSLQARSLSLRSGMDSNYYARQCSRIWNSEMRKVGYTEDAGNITESEREKWGL